MEKLPIKLNNLSTLITHLVEKIQLLDSSIYTKQQKTELVKEIIEVVENLKKFFSDAIDPHIDEKSKNDTDIKKFSESIERAFSEFDWNTSVAVFPLEFDKLSTNGKLLISSILKHLGPKGCGILIVETYLKLCKKTVMEMKNDIEKGHLNKEKTSFKLLLEGFFSTAKILRKFWHIAFSNEQKHTIVLCLHQICKILPFLLNVIKTKNSDMQIYALNLLSKCLTKLLSEIHNSSNLPSHDHGQEFIKMMDFCIYKLSELTCYTKDFPSFIKQVKCTVSAVKPIIDELLCSVMSIAQLTVFEEDSTAIISSSQKILRNLSELNEQIEEENACAIRLIASAIEELLYELEQKANTAMLKLILEVFSKINSPLKNIMSKCRMDIAKDNKALEDLNVLISDFDSEMDKIMQIGFFTISCTKSLKRILGIRSCLASLETLECELIPSLTALYMDCNSKNKSNFQCLFDFWLNEITELKNVIDSVLDPAGFCGVVKSQIKNLGPAIKQHASSDFCLKNLNDSFKDVLRYSRKLIRTLSTSLKDENIASKATEDFLNKFQLAYQECGAVLKLLEEGKDTNHVINQAIKRYDYLVNTLEKLSNHLYDLLSEDERSTNIANDELDESKILEAQVPQRNYYKLCETENIPEPSKRSIPEILTPYVNKALLRSKKRSILYTTPIQLDETEKDVRQTIHTSKYWDKTPTSSKRSRYCKPLTLNLELENTIDLEITTILENVSDLSNTFSKTINVDVDKKASYEKKRVTKQCHEVSCGSDAVTDYEHKPSYSSSGCCAQLNLKTENELDEEKPNEKNLLGFKLRNSFLQALNDLSKNETLLVTWENEPSSVDSPERMDDLKKVEEKINFLKTRMPLEMP